MEKITKGHPLSQSADIVKENLETLKRLFPTIVKEGKIDVEELKALLDEDIETSEEYYRFTWAGKNEGRREANKPSTATLRPCKEESKNWDTTGNIFIEGDNLEVLKLLQKSYAGKIKMMYFDPPYNTGKDFVYKDNYADNLSNYLSLTGQTDEEGKRLNTNTESDGRYHSNWLNMMYPRLKLARNLLTDDGIVFISIDDNEVFNLRKLCDDIFGEENFVSLISLITGANQSGEGVQIQKNVEYCIVYSKSYKDLKIRKVDKINESLRNLNDAPTPLETRDEMGYTIYYNENSGDIIPLKDYDKTKIHLNTVSDVYSNNEDLINKGYVPIRPGFRNKKLHRWRWGIDTFIERKNEIVIQKSDNKFSAYFKQGGFNSPKNYLNFAGGTAELKSLFDGDGIFDFPKSVKYIKYLISIGSSENDIVLDIFAGSGTTAHAVMQQNIEDYSFRKYICIQLPELTDEKSEAFKVGYSTIADICKERLRRSSTNIEEELKNKIKEDKNNNSYQLSFENEEGINVNISASDLLKNFDSGFKAFKLDSSNINAWDGSLSNFNQNLFNAENNIKEERTEEDTLFEILLKYGLYLTVPIEVKEISKSKIYSIGGGVLFVCLSDNITTQIAEAIGKWKEELQPVTCRALFKDNGFKDDIAKTNSIQILRQYGIEEANSI